MKTGGKGLPRGGGTTATVRVARRWRGETTISLKWIAGALLLGSWTYVSNLPGQKGRKSVNGEDTGLKKLHRFAAGGVLLNEFSSVTFAYGTYCRRR
jgi:hypothetical protein